MNSNNDENVDSPKQPQLKDNHFSCSLKELQAMQLTLFRNQWRIQERGLGGPRPPPPPTTTLRLCLDQNEAQRAKKKLFFEAASPAYLTVWMIDSLHSSPPYLKAWIRHW